MLQGQRPQHHSYPAGIGAHSGEPASHETGAATQSGATVPLNRDSFANDPALQAMFQPSQAAVEPVGAAVGSSLPKWAAVLFAIFAIAIGGVLAWLRYGR